MGGVFAGSAARVAGGIGIVGCAAVIALAAGGGNVLSGLGGIFGTSGASLQVAKAGTPAADIVAAPAPTARNRARLHRGRGDSARTAIPRRISARRPPQAPPRTPASQSPASPLPSPAAPGPAPAPAPVPSPAAPPVGSGGTTTSLDQTVKQVTSQLPPQTQPVTKPITDVVDTLAGTCAGLPVCP